MAKTLSGLMAEFATIEGLRSAVDELADAGYVDLDAYSAFPDVHVLERTGQRPWKITRIGGTFALLGALVGYGLQWLLSAHVYPLDVGGRPYHSAPAFIPITFETGVLFCGIATFVATLALSGLPALWREEFEIEGFERVSVDRFWVYVADADPRFDDRATRELLERHDPLRIVHLPEASGVRHHEEEPRP